MRRISCTIISLLISLPAFGDTRLPVVNIAAGGVSARAAFGEEIARPQPIATKTTVAAAKKVVPKRTVTPRPARTNTVAKTAPAQTTTVARAASIDMGDKIANNDVLIPRRPSADLWAHGNGDVPLRMPNVSEFSVVRSDAALPEESLDNAPALARTVIAPVSAPTVDVNNTINAMPMSEIDAQIARLNELQRRADENIRVAAAATEKIQSRPVVTPRVAKKATVTSPVAEPETISAPVANVRQMVVPASDSVVSDDVVVRAVARAETPRIAAVREDMTKMSPTQLRQAFRKTFLSQNKHLSTYQIDDRFDVASDMTSSYEGFTARRDLSESGGIRPLEIKIKFRNDDAALSRDNYNLLSEYAGIVVSNPTRAVQISIPQKDTTDSDTRKLSARRLAIVEQALRDSGVSEQRILPVLSDRSGDGFVLRMISGEQYETMYQQYEDNKKNATKKTYKSLTW